MKQQGPFVIISGPSGVGKTSFIKKCLEHFSQFSNTISWTTRPKRKDEKEGDFYYFTTKDKFKKMIEKDEFLEWAKVHNELYATSKKEVTRLWIEGKAIIKDVDVQGYKSIKKKMPGSVSIFIYPPSIDELKKRILKRNMIDKNIDERLSIASQEIAHGRKYDFKIINDSFEEAWIELKSILNQSLKQPFQNS